LRQHESRDKIKEVKIRRDADFGDCKIMNKKNNHVYRHGLFNRIFHWVMAGCILILLFTGVLPVLGVKFEWIEIHWIAGSVLTVIVIIHIIKSSSLQKYKSMWVTIKEIKGFVAVDRKVKGGKYSLEQKMMHHGMTFFSLISILTGFLMLLKLDTPFWDRDPFIFTADVWGIIYLLHGISTLFFVSFIMLHIYFSLRPEKLFYTRSMIKGWITKDEYNENHDPIKWKLEELNKKENKE
jgi:formate dehydrogenase subunit gamma